MSDRAPSRLQRRLQRFAAQRRALANAPSRPRYRYVRLRWRVLFAIVDAVGYACRWMVTRVLGAGPSGLADPRRILVVQQDHLGDAILSTGLLRGLRHRYPAATIDVLASDANRELFAACAEVDEVLTASVNRLSRGRRRGWIWSVWQWGLRLRRRQYDLAIDPRGEFSAAALMWLSGTPRRLGWSSGGGGFLLTDVADYVLHRAEAASRQALLDRLGIAPPTGQAVWQPRVEPNFAARRWAEEKFPMLLDDRPLVVCHLGAGTAAKRWPARHWQSLLCLLTHDGQIEGRSACRVVLIGTAEDRVNLPEASPIEDFTGQLTFQQLAALLERADLLIGADSGPAHLAAAVGTSVVVLFSGTNHASQWQPWGERVTVVSQPVACSPCHRQTCPLADHPCLAELSPAAVRNAAEHALRPCRTNSITFDQAACP